MERRQRRGAGGAPIVEKHTERGQRALLGLGQNSRFGAPENQASYQLLAITIDHYWALAIKSARFLAPFAEKRDQRSYLLVELARSGAYRDGNATGQRCFTNDRGFRLRGRTELPAGEFSGLAQGFDEAAFVGDAFACDVERRPMIDGSSHHRQADGDVHT